MKLGCGHGDVSATVVSSAPGRNRRSRVPFKSSVNANGRSAPAATVSSDGIGARSPDETAQVLGASDERNLLPFQPSETRRASPRGSATPICSVAWSQSMRRAPV